MNRSKAKGTAWERRLVGYLVAHGFPGAERRALEGKNDRGDVSGTHIVWEAKNAARITLAEWVDEMLVEKKNAGAEIGVVVFPRRNCATSRAYVVMELAQFVEMVK